jgi:hypothetical protein
MMIQNIFFGDGPAFDTLLRDKGRGNPHAIGGDVKVPTRRQLSWMQNARYPHPRPGSLTAEQWLTDNIENERKQGFRA